MPISNTVACHMPGCLGHWFWPFSFSDCTALQSWIFENFWHQFQQNLVLFWLSDFISGVCSSPFKVGIILGSRWIPNSPFWLISTSQRECSLSINMASHICLCRELLHFFRTLYEYLGGRPFPHGTPANAWLENSYHFWSSDLLNVLGIYPKMFCGIHPHTWLFSHWLCILCKLSHRQGSGLYSCQVFLGRVGSLVFGTTHLSRASCCLVSQRLWALPFLLSWFCLFFCYHWPASPGLLVWLSALSWVYMG